MFLLNTNVPEAGLSSDLYLDVLDVLQLLQKFALLAVTVRLQILDVPQDGVQHLLDVLVWFRALGAGGGGDGGVVRGAVDRSGRLGTRSRELLQHVIDQIFICVQNGAEVEHPSLRRETVKAV